MSMHLRTELQNIIKQNYTVNKKGKTPKLHGRNWGF